LLEKKYRLRKNKDFKKVYARQSSNAVRNLVLYSLNTNTQGDPRFGISVSKRVGNSVMRNLTRRRIREAIRPHLDVLPQGTDFVIIARQRIVNASFEEIKADLEKLLRRSGYLRKR
jgi:ribonuclease P protein component